MALLDSETATGEVLVVFYKKGALKKFPKTHNL